jgi:hypothetical protein
LKSCETFLQSLTVGAAQLLWNGLEVDGLVFLDRIKSTALNPRKHAQTGMPHTAFVQIQLGFQTIASVFERDGCMMPCSIVGIDKTRTAR